MAKMPIAVLGIDLGKNSCSVAGLDANGAVVLRRRMGRDGLVTFASKLPACIVAMEACCGAHFLGRTFASQGHTVRLMPPEYVQPLYQAANVLIHHSRGWCTLKSWAVRIARRRGLGREKEVKRRADVVGIFPNEAPIVRLIGAVLLEQNDEWQLQHRYMQVEAWRSSSHRPM